MARARRTTSTISPAAPSADQFSCPECGKSFSRAASLGAHRNRAHGITGTTKRRTKSQPASSKTTRRLRRTTNRRPITATTPTRREAGAATIDRNQLLETLFPNGVPPREDVIRRVGSWLDEADQLAKL